MNAISFILNYNFFLERLEQVIKPELQPALENLKNTDPHDLVRPDNYFSSSSEASGYIYNLFIVEAKKLSLIK